MDINQSLANIIIEHEQEKFPYFILTQIEIIESTEEIVKYRCKVTSKMDSKWSLWSSTKEINMSKLISENRDVKLNFLLEN
jgi:hypothetical protein